MEDEGVAGNDFLTELHVVDFHEVGGVAFGVVDGGEDEEAAGLCHRFNLEYAGEDGLLGEVALEEGLVGGDVFDAYDVVLTFLYDFVDEEEGVAVGEEFADAHVVHYGLFGGVVDGSLDFLALDFAADFLGELGVDGVAGSGGDDAALEGTAYEGDVADDVEEFVACGLVVEGEGAVVDVAEFVDFLAGYAHEVGEAVELVLREGGVVDYDGVVEVAAFDEVVGDEGFDFAHEHEGAACCDLAVEVGDVFECGKLVGEDGRGEVDFDVDGEVVVGEDDD